MPTEFVPTKRRPQPHSLTALIDERSEWDDFSTTNVGISRYQQELQRGDLLGSGDPLMVDIAFQSAEATTVSGEPDPLAWYLRELAGRLDTAEALTNRASTILHHAQLVLARAREVRREQEAAAETSADAAVYGEPKRRVRLKGQVVRTRRGEPLVAPEDLSE